MQDEEADKEAEDLNQLSYFCVFDEESATLTANPVINGRKLTEAFLKRVARIVIRCLQ
jgi:hypothetical protein